MKTQLFMALIGANGCNPCISPDGENAPRMDYEGYGILEPAYIKRRIRNEFPFWSEEEGMKVLCQMQNALKGDNYLSQKDRMCGDDEIVKKIINASKRTRDDLNTLTERLLNNYADVRLFGGTLAFSGKKDEGSGSLTHAIRGAVTIGEARTVAPLDYQRVTIVKSYNSQTDETDPSKKGSDTMGSRYVVRNAYYLVTGTVNDYLAEKNHVTERDIDVLKKTLSSLFEHDASDARPAGSMWVERCVWLSKREGALTPAVGKIMKSVEVIEKDGKPDFEVHNLDNVTAEFIV